MQKKQRFVADQRYDLPQHDSMLGLIDAEFFSYNKGFITPANKILKGWKILNNGGLQVKVDQATNSILFNSQRAGHENLIFRESTATALTLNLSDNATNYVEVQIATGTCASDTVALWDTTANGGIGQEFTQTIDTVTVERPSLVSNTIDFTGDTDKLPLAIVVTVGGLIVSITDERDFLYHLSSDWNFGATRTDKTIGSLKDSFDALATAIKEAKGATNWYDKPFGSVRQLKEFQNLFISGGGLIEWEGSQGMNTLGWSSALSIEIANRPTAYTITAGSATLNDGDALYVVIPDTGTVLTPVVAQLTAVPINPASTGYDPGIQVLFFRRGTTIYGLMDIPELDAGESAHIGMDLPQKIRERLGILSETSYRAYSSTLIVSQGDDYAQAISKLDLAANTALSDTAEEETILATEGQTVVNFANIAFDPSNASFDVKISQDGVQLRHPDHYLKTGPSQITTTYALFLNEAITGRMEKSPLATLPSQAYFVNYFEGLTGASIATGSTYNTGTDKLSLYRNGLMMVKSASTSFAPSDRYVESSSNSVLLAYGASPVDWLGFVNLDAPAIRVQSTGLTGTVLSVPSYVIGNGSLRVYRNGLMMNTSSLGGASDKYAETATTSITLSLAATTSDVFTFYVTVAPAFRQDLTGHTGNVLPLPAPITVGDKRLLVFKNGVFMLDSATMATAGERYQETSGTQITLGTAAITTDVFTLIYQ